MLLSVHHIMMGQDQMITIEAKAKDMNDQVIEWRRHFHQFPELSNREFKTAETIATILENMGLPVETGIAHTGVVAVLDTGRQQTERFLV